MMSTITISQSPPSPAVRGAHLKPKEHGAYAILAIPLVTGLVAAGPTLVGGCIAAAAFTGFLAHEPLLVTLGHRGG